MDSEEETGICNPMESNTDFENPSTRNCKEIDFVPAAPSRKPLRIFSDLRNQNRFWQSLETNLQNRATTPLKSAPRPVVVAAG
jgi:hypothetical protein